MLNTFSVQFADWVLVDLCIWLMVLDNKLWACVKNYGQFIMFVHNYGQSKTVALCMAVKEALLLVLREGFHCVCMCVWLVVLNGCNFHLGLEGAAGC